MGLLLVNLPVAHFLDPPGVSCPIFFWSCGALTVKVKLVWVGLFDSKGWVSFFSGELADTSHTRSLKDLFLIGKKNRLIEKEGLTSFLGQWFDGPYLTPVPPGKFSSSGDLLFSLKDFPGLFNEPLLLGQTKHVQVGKFMKKVCVGKSFCKCWQRFETAVRFQFFFQIPK